jgi:hypothetical protein
MVPKMHRAFGAGRTCTGTTFFTPQLLKRNGRPLAGARCRIALALAAALTDEARRGGMCDTTPRPV